MTHKAFRWSKLFSKSEIKLFQNYLIQNHKEKLLSLFKLIIIYQDEKDISKENIFEKIYHDTYSSKKDYLLRNDMRLLVAEIKKFAAQQMFLKKANQNIDYQNLFFIQWLKEKKNWTFSKSEWKKWIESAKNNGNFYEAAHMQKLWIEDFIQFQHTREEDYKQLLQEINDYDTNNLFSFQYNHYEIALKKAFALRTLKAINDKESYHFNATDFSPQINISCKDPYIDFCKIMIQTYILSGLEKIKLLKTALILVAKIQKTNFDHNKVKDALQASIALEYFLSKDYKTSLKYHKTIFNHHFEVQEATQLTYVFNYISTLLRLNRFDEALKIIFRYENHWQSNIKMRDRFQCIKGIAFLLLHKTEEAWECVPQNIKSSGLDHYYYYRFLLIAVYTQNKTYDLALSELESFIHTIKYNDQNKGFLKLCSFMKKILLAINHLKKYSPEKFKEKMLKVTHDIKLNQHHFENSDHFLLHRWLLNFCEHSIKI